MKTNRSLRSSKRRHIGGKASLSASLESIKAVPCAIYARSATEEDPNPERHAVVAQQQRCSRAIWEKQAEGWVHRVTLSDPNCSGASPYRLGLQLLIAMAKARQIKVVVVYGRDRLARSMELSASIQAELDRHGVKVYSCLEGMCSDSPVSRLIHVLLRASAAPKLSKVRSVLRRRMQCAVKA